MANEHHHLYAYDRSKGKPTTDLESYFHSAIEQVLKQKEHYAEAEARARKQRPQRSPAFDVMAMMGAMGGSFDPDEDQASLPCGTLYLSRQNPSPCQPLASERPAPPSSP